MRVYRFMSNKELGLFLSGKKIVGKRSYGLNQTTSTGVCFLHGNTRLYECETCNLVYDLLPVDLYREILEGIVSDELCVCFDTNATFTRGQGIYSHPYKDYGGVFIEELNIPQYSRRGFILRGFCDLQRRERKLFLKEGIESPNFSSCESLYKLIV